MKNPSYPEAVKAQLKEKDTISSIIDAIRTGTYAWAHSEAELHAVADREAAKDLWNGELKVERTALQALAITELWPAYEAIKKAKWEQYRTQARSELEGPDTMMVMQTATYSMFADALSEWDQRRGMRQDLTITPPDPLDAAYGRLSVLMEFGKKHGFVEAKAPKGELILKGFGTAAVITWALIELVPRLAKENNLVLTQEEMIGAIRSAYGPLIAMYMNINEEVSNAVQQHMIEQMDAFSSITLASKFFTLQKGKKGEYVVVLNHEAMMNIKDESGIPLLQKIPLSTTPGCPAAYTGRDGVNVMQRYFDESIELAKIYYFPEVSTG